MITELTYFLDGGTAEIIRDGVHYFVDRRIGTKTKNVVFVGHPDKGILCEPVIASEILKYLFTTEAKDATE